VVVLWKGIAAAAAAGLMLSGVAAGAAENEPPNQTLLFFAGSDFWKDGDFLHGGLLWSPAGIDNDGFTLKMLVSGGRYRYTSGSLNAEVDGTMVSGAALPGWRFKRGDLTVTFYGGPVVQDFRLRPNDPGSRLDGFYLGAAFATEVWYQPTAQTMASLSGTITSIGPTGVLRLAVGFKLFEPVFIGPETQQFWCGDFEEVQFGVHFTGLHMSGFEWSAGSGWAITSDHRSGPYLRIGVNTRY